MNLFIYIYQIIYIIRLYLSNVDIGDIYLNSIGSITPTSTLLSPYSTSISPSKLKIGYELPKMNFGQFWQVNCNHNFNLYAYSYIL